MVKCVVSRCPNRMVSVNRGVFQRPRKRFFNFPKDPARVKVWLAALRDTDQQDASEQHFICEDHFLPEDISTNGIIRDAIPIMPPWLDGTLGPLSSWRTGSSEEEDNEDNEEEEEEEEEESGAEAPTALDPPQQTPGKGPEKAPEAESTRASLPQMNLSKKSESISRRDVSLELLTRRFLELLLAAPDSALDLRDAAENLQTYKQRLYNITQVLKGLDLVQEEQTSWVKWTGKVPISCFLWRNLQREVENLKLVEDRLDRLIRICARQLFHMTDDTANATSAYVTHEDIRGLRSVQQKTVILIKAPEETKLDIPAPQESSIQVHLKACRGPIKVHTCEVGSGDTVTSDPSVFLMLEESRIRTTILHIVSPHGGQSV